MWKSIKNAYWAVYRFFVSLRRFPKEVKWHWQRAFRGWADCDVWDMNGYLTQLIPGMLRHLKAHSTGYPMHFQGMEYNDKNEVVYQRTNEEAAAAWDACLQSIIDGLEAYDRVEDSFDFCGTTQEDIDQYLKDLNAAIDKRTKVFHLMAEHFGSLWD